MSTKIVEPSPGTSPSEGQSDDRPAAVGSANEGHGTSPRPAPGPQPNGPGTASADDLGMSLSQLCPDPFLGEFAPEASRSEATANGPGNPASHAFPTTGASALEGIDLDVPPSASAEIPAVTSISSGVSAVVSALDLGPAAAVTDQGRASSRDAASFLHTSTSTSTSTTQQFAAIDLYAPTPASARGEAVSSRGKVAPDDDGDEFEDLPPRGTGRGLAAWMMPWVLSYASAVTIGLLWVIWGHRVPRVNESVEPDPFPPAETATDPGHRADRSRKVVAAQPLSDDRIVKLGQALRLGSLEVTPLEIAVGQVTLRREINPFEARSGGEDALQLKLRLKNISADSILVPLDEAFIRERGRGVRDSFVEAGKTQRIEMYPLAVESEWSLLGQEFRELGPGESYETSVFTAPVTSGLLVPEMTWRIRLRTGLNQTDTLGVRFRESEVRRRPGHAGDEVGDPT